MNHFNAFQDDIHQRERHRRRNEHRERDERDEQDQTWLQEQHDLEFARHLDRLYNEDVRLADLYHEQEVQNLIRSTAEPTVPYDPGNLIVEDDDSEDNRNAGNVPEENRPAEADARYAGPQRACVSCGERSNIPAVPCGHQYCAECLTGVLRNAMSDGTAFPPRCCRQNLEIDQIRMHLDPAFAVEFDRKAVELSTVNPVYCSDATCSRFISPSEIRGEDTARCPDCLRQTCTHCKAQAHGGNCPEDQGLQQLLQVAEGEGWRRCECGRVIELNYGCNHMTCQCRREFCYLCGVRWKNCACAQWQEDRLIRRAEQFVDRRAGLLVPLPAAARPQAPAAAAFVRSARPDLDQLIRVIAEDDAVQAPVQPPPPMRRPHIPAPINRQERIQHAADQLRENANCTHPLNWRRTGGPHPVCEFNNRHRSRIYSCKHCGLTACYGCRRNRL